MDKYCITCAVLRAILVETTNHQRWEYCPVCADRDGDYRSGENLKVLLEEVMTDIEKKMKLIEEILEKLEK